MPDYAAAIGGGYKPLAQTTITEASGATPFASLTGGRAYTLQVKSGTLKINFLGNAGDYLELGAGIYSDTVDFGSLKTARVDPTSAFTAVLFLQGVA